MKHQTSLIFRIHENYVKYADFRSMFTKCNFKDSYCTNSANTYGHSKIEPRMELHSHLNKQVDD